MPHAHPWTCLSPHSPGSQGQYPSVDWGEAPNLRGRSAGSFRQSWPELSPPTVTESACHPLPQTPSCQGLRGTWHGKAELEGEIRELLLVSSLGQLRLNETALRLLSGPEFSLSSDAVPSGNSLFCPEALFSDSPEHFLRPFHLEN